MDAAVCYSGGTDSTLAALALDRFYEVTCVTGSFGLTDDASHATAAAEAVGFPTETVPLDDAVARDAVETMVADGFPRNGIQQVHEHALEVVAGTDYGTIGDGTRRDDRAPTVSRALAQSIEDRYGVDYVAPLAGYGRGAIDALAADRLEIVVGPSETIARGDYEAELRALMRDEYGAATVADVFPAHEQSRVIGVREA